MSDPALDRRATRAETREHPLLLLLLDGVAYERIRGLHDAGHFRRFRAPARLISVFPTLTDPAYDLLFGTGPTPGYEAGYFDRAANRLSPAIFTYLRGRNEAWVRHVHYRLSFLYDAVMYLFPRWVYRRELRRCRRILDARLAAGERQVVLYILSTDGLAHMLAPDEIDRELLLLDAWLDNAIERRPNGLDVVMLSDHGLGRLPPGCEQLEAFDLPGVLRAAGLRLTRRLRRPGDVVLPLFGLLDVARLHTYDAATRDRAVAALRNCPPIELTIARRGETLEIFAASGAARVWRTDGADGPCYGYEALAGDPLQLAPACERLRILQWQARLFINLRSSPAIDEAASRRRQLVPQLTRMFDDMVRPSRARERADEGRTQSRVRCQQTTIEQRSQSAPVRASLRPLPSAFTTREKLREPGGCAPENDMKCKCLKWRALIPLVLAPIISTLGRPGGGSRPRTHVAASR